jgi:ribonuclease VapC
VADWDLTRRAAHLKARHRLSYADCFAAALAQQRDAELVTGDQEFRPLARDVKLHWL